MRQRKCSDEARGSAKSVEMWDLGILGYCYLVFQASLVRLGGSHSASLSQDRVTMDLTASLLVP